MNGFEQKENVVENVSAGIVGAFLFSLIGGVIWFILYQIGILAAFSGFVGVICAVKGYEIFAKKQSVKGVVIAAIMAIIVMVFAWYMCFSYDIYNAYQSWFQEGEIDFTLTFSESVQVAPEFLAEPEIGPAYLKDLALGLLFAIIGGASYIINTIKVLKAAKNAPKPVEIMPEAPVEASAEESESTETSGEENNG